MANVCSPTDVADLLGATFTPAEIARCDRLIGLAEGLIASEIPGIQFVATTTTVTVDGTLDDVLILPIRPITAITAIRIDGQTIDSDSYRWTSRGELYRVTGPWVQTLGVYGAWGGPTVQVEVDCTAGPHRDDLRLVAAELVRDLWVNPGRANSETLGQRSVNWGRTSTSMQLTEAQCEICDTYEPRVSTMRIGLS